MNRAPIFIHSLFRAGSTYLFNVFRRSDLGYWCYQESLHEAVIDANDNPDHLLRGRGGDLLQQLRHPRMELPYFHELRAVWPAWKNKLSSYAIYGGYFAPPNTDIGVSYWRALIDAAEGRPVFQECRTAGRIGAINQQLGGFHIYLWRNPWDQWLSYKIDRYFDVANQLIIGASNSPPVILQLNRALASETRAPIDLPESFAYFWLKPLSSEESYLVFYTLWCLGLQEGAQHAHLMLNIDRLSDSPAYRFEMQSQLAETGIDRIDFVDCQIPQACYLQKDQSFFGALEDKVHQWLKEGGWSQGELEHVQALRHKFEPETWGYSISALSPQDMAEQASRARAVARRFETNAAEIVRISVANSVESGARANEAESRAVEAESRANQAESRAVEAESRANQAESRAVEAESRATEAELLTSVSEKKIAALLNSKSWKVTAPIRTLWRFIGWH
jgi:hypothetical protein